jgi:hypothetical protein
MIVTKYIHQIRYFKVVCVGIVLRMFEKKPQVGKKFAFHEKVMVQLSLAKKS